MNKSTELLIKLMDNVKCIHLDMGGNNKYHLTHKAMPIITEIKAYLAERHLTAVEADAFCRCESPDIVWNHNQTKWTCIFCGAKGTT